MRRPLLITAVLLSLPLLASAADLAVTVSFLPNPIAVGDALAWNAVVRNASGPAAQNVTLTFRASSEFQLATTLASPSCSGDAVIRCTAATLSPGQQVGFQVIAKAVAAGVGDLIVFAEEAGVNDPTTGDNVVTSPIVIKNNPRLSVSCTSPQSSFIVDPNSEATLTCLFGNSGVDDGHDVTLTIDLTGDATFAGPPAGHQTDCTLDAGGTRVECVTPLMRTNDSATVDVSIRAPDKRSGQFGAQAVATSRDVPFSDKAVQSNKAWGLPLSFLVTNTDDDGGGSLRQAIRDANVACNSKAPGVECLVAFHIPASLAIDGVYTIRPRTPLPALTGRSIVVGGDSQRLFAGDSNPKGLEIEINGSRLDAGPGFGLTSGQTLREITINGFPGPGVAIAGGSLCCDGVTIRNCYIGTDAAGMRAVPNDRGIVVNLHALIYSSAIENNVISGNRFSGIFISSATQSISIKGNIIGAGADGVTSLGNGASGIYTADSLQFIDQGEIDDNLIAHNKQWGIAIATGGSATMHRNRIVDNGYQGIDHGLDLSIATGGIDADRYPNAPLLLMAHYDSVSGKTLIAGHLEAHQRKDVVIELDNLELFASDTAGASDFPQAQRFLLEVLVGPGDFLVSVPGDLTGQWLSGTISRTRFTPFTDPEGFPALAIHAETSDLGPAIRVSP